MENPTNPPQSTYTPGANPPKNWLVESILVTIFCCLPFGIVGIINAANVSSRWNAGDHAGAQRASEEAGKWTKIGFFIGIALIVISFVLSALGVFGTGMFMNRGDMGE